MNYFEGPVAASPGSFAQALAAFGALECHWVFYEKDQEVPGVVQGPFLEDLDFLWVVQEHLWEDPL